MDLRNKTAYEAGFFNGVVSETGILASVVVRSTFKVVDGELQIDTETPVPVAGTPTKIGASELDGEGPFLRNGVDFFIWGDVYSPENNPVESLFVDIEVGSQFKRQLKVTGNRHWEKRWNKIVPSKVEPFKQMALSYENSYGGVAEGETLPVEFGHNPKGKGFYLEEAEAIGNALPNLEDSANLVQKWDDRPNPVGTEPYPANWGLKLLNCIEADEQDAAKMARIKPELFNNAHPEMIVYEPIVAGDVIRISHLTKLGDFKFKVPDTTMHVHVQLENRHFLFPLVLESIGVLAEEGKVFFTSRVAFNYEVIPLERRIVSLYSGSQPESIPCEYVIDWDCEGDI